jgi:MFS transporter, DHA2 family, multidrug resistance protein
MNALSRKVRNLSVEAQHFLLITAVMMGATIQIIDTTIANVALPHIQGSFSTTQEYSAWILTSYIMATAITMPLTGWLAGRIGRKRLLVLSVLGFTLASMACGAAQSLNQMIAFRVLQGIFGASLLPLSQSILLNTFPVEKHAKANAILGIGVMVAPILGPTAGGWLTEYYNWRWVFYINVPFGVLSLLGISVLAKESPLDKERPFDLPGFMLLSIAIVGLQLMLDRGQSLYWLESPEIVFELIVAVLAFYLFIVHMFTQEHPYIDPKLFADRNFSLAIMFMFTLGIIVMATMALLPPYLQNLMGYPVFDAGVILAPRGVGTVLSMVLSSRILQRGLVAPRYLIVTGLLLVLLSMWQMTGFSINVTRSMITWTGFIQGMGLGFIFVTISTLAFATLPLGLQTEAASIFALARTIGSSLGISIVVAALSNNLQEEHARLTESISEFNPLVNNPELSPLWDIHTASGLALLDSEVSRQAAQIAYIDDFQLIMMMALAAIPLALLLRSPGKKAG